MLATVRNRRGVVAAVEPFDGDNGRLHLVHLEYKDWRSPSEERLLWELEPHRALDEPNALPDPASLPMPPEDFDALLRAARWTALSPWLDPDGDGPLGPQPVASPFHGGVRIENYQLVPLLKALSMPRVSLLIADDVGLGKTVEAGLILTELLLRRRIRRVLILTPASLRHQWRDELHDKFALRFEVVDRKATDRLRRRLGMDANPWRSFDRIVASYHYLRQPDVREQFLAASRVPEGSPQSPHLPWDLLIVDECHHLMPAPLGEDSELCRTLRLVAPQFEHRLFLSATPHNGHTRSFTGLLEMLDPVRFTRTSEMGDAMRRRVRDVVIRRLKRQVNEGSAAPRFGRREPPQAVPLDADPREAALATAFDAFRDRSTPPSRRRNEVPPARRDLRGGDPREAAALLPDRVRRVVAPDPPGVPGSGGGHRDGRGGGRARAPPRDRRRPGDRGARSHRGGGHRCLAPELRRGRERPDPRHRARAHRPRIRPRRPSDRRADPCRRCPLRRARRADRAAAARRRGVPRRRTPGRLHRIQDHARLPGAAAARALSVRPHSHPLRRGPPRTA